VHEFIAYQLRPAHGLRIVPAPRERSWMDETFERFAYRCLPMLVANQAGWMVLNSHAFVATWNGGPLAQDLEIQFTGPPSESHILSHFGYGMVTWKLPFLFRTPPGFNLLARGPANHPKHGACPLEGLIEADWAVAPFTMNWRLTKGGESVTFLDGEPICMLVPQRRGELEALAPRMRSIQAEPSLAAEFAQWSASRQAFESGRETSLVSASTFQRHYLRGQTVTGREAEHHQLKLSLKPFREG
jgi:hypothetical protein